MSDDEKSFQWRTRGESLRVTKNRKLDETFKGRKFEIVREIHLASDQVFQTRFGNKARHGYVIRDVETGEEMVVGNNLLRLINQRYQAVELPVRRRGRPPKVR